MARRCEPLTETRDVTTADLLRTLIDRVEHVCVEVALARVDIARHDAKIDLLLDRKHALTRADRALLVVMLPPIAGAFGSHAFASREVRESRSPGVRPARAGISASQPRWRASGCSCGSRSTAATSPRTG